MRLTGGEPLLSAADLALPDQVRPRVEGAALRDLALTTNGLLLTEAQAETSARRRDCTGRITVSLDTLRPERPSAELTRRDELERVLAGIAMPPARLSVSAVSSSSTRWSCGASNDDEV